MKELSNFESAKENTNGLEIKHLKKEALDYIIKAEAGVLAKKHGKTYYKNPFCFGEA